MHRSRLTFILLLIIIGSVGIVAFTKSNIFLIKKIVINSSVAINKDKIRQSISFSTTPNILYFPGYQVKERILSNNHYLQKVRIRKNFLAKTVNILLKERKPFANIIAYPSNYIIDKKGVVLNPGLKVTRAEVDLLPMVTGIKSSYINGKTQLPEKYAHVVTFTLEKLLKIFKNKSIKFDLKDTDNLSLLTTDLVEVKLGNSKNLTHKLKVLDVLMKNIGTKVENATYINVSVPSHPVIKYSR
jgi:cell division septal protein FtsQ